MRQVTVQVPRGTGRQLIGPARELGASTLVRFDGTGGSGDPVDVLTVTVPNASVGPLIDRAQQLGEVEASVPATGVFAFEPPAGEPPEELVDVTARSPYEVVLAGQQSAGSWKGFLAYAAVAGVVVWLGLFTETWYLLTASMLIAPYAGPAMNTAIAIVTGRSGLLGHSLFRYATGIAVTAIISGLLTVVAGQHVATDLMAEVLTITLAAFLLPTAAGVAGASFLVQSEHSSLISGAAVGILVAASLAPPAGGLGMALALGRPDLVVLAAFLIALQLTGITASAIVVLWLYGVRPRRVRFGSHRPRMLIVGLVASVALTGVLVATQWLSAPLLMQGSEERHAAEIATSFLDAHEQVTVLGVAAQVASAQVPGVPRIVVEPRVERHDDTSPAGELEAELERALVRELQDRISSVVPHVDVTVFDPPPQPSAR